jgi:DNA-binding XRE family transcriptional regulator
MLFRASNLEDGMAGKKPGVWEREMAQKIRDLRDARQLTQEKLAQLVQVTTKTVWLWEHGERVPNLKTAARLAKVLGCTIDELAGVKKAGKK